MNVSTNVSRAIGRFVTLALVALVQPLHQAALAQDGLGPWQNSNFIEMEITQGGDGKLCPVMTASEMAAGVLSPCETPTLPFLLPRVAPLLDPLPPPPVSHCTITGQGKYKPRFLFFRYGAPTFTMAMKDSDSIGSVLKCMKRVHARGGGVCQIEPHSIRPGKHNRLERSDRGVPQDVFITLTRRED